MSSQPQSTTKNHKQAQSCYLQGLQLLKKQKPKQAIPHLEKALDLKPTYRKAQIALEGAYNSLGWNTFHFCENCAHFIHPTKVYPDLQIPSICPQCGQRTSTQLERIIGITEFTAKILLFGMFPVMAFVLSFLPQWQVVHGGVFLKYTPIIASIFNALNYTPFFILLFLQLDSSGTLLNNAYITTLHILQPAQIHPFLTFTVEIIIFFTVIYGSLLFIFTPIFYMHKKGYWRTREHQKRLILVTSIIVALVVLRRVSLGVFR